MSEKITPQRAAEISAWRYSLHKEHVKDAEEAKYYVDKFLEFTTVNQDKLDKAQKNYSEHYDNPEAREVFGAQLRDREKERDHTLNLVGAYGGRIVTSQFHADTVARKAAEDVAAHPEAYFDAAVADAQAEGAHIKVQEQDADAQPKEVHKQ